MVLYELEGVTYGYPLTKGYAVKDVNLHIEHGETIIITGPSGCGKSTLLRALVGIVPRFYGGTMTGCVRLCGRGVPDLHPGKVSREVGLVGQNPEKQIVMTTVERELAFGMENTAVSPSEMRRRMAEVLDFLGISHLRSRATYSLSGGEKQLVVLAAVLTMLPSVLLLDEPFSQVDPVAADRLLQVILRLNREWGITVIAAEQRLDRCVSDFNRIIFMDRGEVKVDISPREFVCWAAAHYPYVVPTVPKFFSAVYPNLGELPLSVREGKKVLGLLGLYKGAAAPGPGELKAGTPGDRPILEVKRLSFGYSREEDALRGVSFNLFPGHFLGILGHNGAGKSTLLKAVSRLVKPQQGDIRIEGESILKTAPEELAGRVGYLSQDPSDYLCHDTVGEEITYTLNKLGLPVSVYAEDAARRLDIAHLMDCNPIDLSAGERQRVALASVLACRPKLLLLDEPTRGIDMQLRQVMGEVLRDITLSGAAVVVVTHDVDFVAQFASHAAVMFQGEIAVFCSKHRVLAEGFYYTSQINRLFRDLDTRIVTIEDAEAVCRSRKEEVF